MMTFFNPLIESLSMETLSPTLKRGLFSSLWATAMITLSNILAALLIISICPYVTGSNVPGYTAILDFFICQPPHDEHAELFLKLLLRCLRIFVRPEKESAQAPRRAHLF